MTADQRVVLSIGQVSEMTDLSIHALRFFEREGLFLRNIPRSRGGQRIYDTADVEWLILCKRFRESGMSIAAVKEFAELVRQGSGNETQRLVLLRNHERVVKEKIAKLTEDLKIIHDKVIIYESHLKNGTAEHLWSPRSPRTA